jgi:hypothetical protein
MWVIAFLMGSQRNCDSFNIDNVELHACIDIPAIINSDCNYDPTRTMKQAWFLIDTASVDMDYYLRYNKFLILNHTSDVGFADFLNLDSNISNSRFSKRGLYYTKGKAKRMSGVEESWKTLLDLRTGKVWTTIYYNDQQEVKE